MNRTLQTWRALAGLGTGMLRARLTRQRAPLFLSLYLTNRCNLRCTYCFVRDPEIPGDVLRMEYSRDEALRIIDEFYALGTRMIFLLGGEPLLHPAIGEIIAHIVARGIYLQVVSNGLLLTRHLAALRQAHALCVSLDGEGAVNDVTRGSGVFAAVLPNIRTAVAAGIPTRVHAVLNRNNLHALRPLAERCRELGVSLTVSPPNYLGATGHANLRLSDDEYRAFWRDYLAMADAGLPIGNTRRAITLCRDWPVGYHRYLAAGEQQPGYRPVFCVNGHTYIGLGADGTLYNCINLGCLRGPNIRQVGIRAAWEQVLAWRPDCVSCASINCIETALLLGFDREMLCAGLRLHRPRVRLTVAQAGATLPPAPPRAPGAAAGKENTP